MLGLQAATHPRSTRSAASPALVEHQLVAFPFLFCSFFPWIGPIRFGTDIQPYALMFATLAVFNLARLERFPKHLVWLFVPVLIAIVYAIDVGLEFSALRSLGGYVGLFVITIASYFTFRRVRENGFFYLSVLGVYLAAGVIQLTYDPDVFQFLLSREQGYGGIGGRGVESLAAEPTFLGIHAMIIVFLCVSSPYITDRAKVFAMLLGATIIFAIARSSTAIASLLVIALLNISLVFTFLRSRPLRSGILLLLGAGLAVVIVLTWPEDSRFFRLVTLLIDSPLTALAVDQSLSERVSHAVFSLVGFMDKPILGHGFLAWTPFLSEVQQDYDLGLYVESGDDRISSFIGGSLFELGIFALPIFYLIWRGAVLGAQRRSLIIWAQISFWGVLLLQSVPLSYPLLALWLGRTYAFSTLRTGVRGPIE